MDVGLNDIMWHRQFYFRRWKEEDTEDNFFKWWLTALVFDATSLC